MDREPEQKNLSGGHLPSVSAALPAYNDEAVIALSIHDVAEAPRGLTDDFENVVTHDVSQGQYGAILGTLPERVPRLNLRTGTHERNAAAPPASY